MFVKQLDLSSIFSDFTLYMQFVEILRLIMLSGLQDKKIETNG